MIDYNEHKFVSEAEKGVRLVLIDLEKVSESLAPHCSENQSFQAHLILLQNSASHVPDTDFIKAATKQWASYLIEEIVISPTLALSQVTVKLSFIFCQ